MLDEWDNSFVEHAVDLAKALAQGTNEIPDTAWNMNLFDLQAYFGLIIATPEKRFFGEPPRKVWDQFLVVLKYAAKGPAKNGEGNECFRRARQNLTLIKDKRLAAAFPEDCPVDLAINEHCKVAWPPGNVTIVTKEK